MKLGIDIEEVDRFVEMRKTALKKIFTARELDYINVQGHAFETMAGMYCAKEAFYKALGTGIRTLRNLLDLEVLHDELGAPYYYFQPRLALELAGEYTNFQLSISHTMFNAVAVCIMF